VIIQHAFKKNGYDITLDEALRFWSERSEFMAAGWLILYDDLDVIFEETMKYSEAAYILENRKKAIEITDEIKDILENKIDLETKEKIDALLEQLLSEVLG
jgi:hypothetical protein